MAEEKKDCTACNGRGYVLTRVQKPDGEWTTVQSTCELCRGRGKA